MHCQLPHHLYVWCDNKFINGKEGTTAGVLHGLFSRQGQIVMTHVLLETGAHWTGVPLHGIYSVETPDSEVTPHSVQPWGAMGSEINCTKLNYLEGLRVEIFKSGWRGRSTGIIVDWFDGFSRYPEQHKPLHLLEMDTGHYSLQPNNYLRWFDPSFIDQNRWRETKDYRRGEQVWWPEDGFSENNK
jgi:hypothetical protein